jgi:hypothetical protein
MLDTILSYGTGLDWMTWVYALARTALEGGVEIGVDAAAGWDRGDVARLLRANGVRCWGFRWMPGADYFIFSVPRASEERALDVLAACGLPLVY